MAPDGCLADGHKGSSLIPSIRLQGCTAGRTTGKGSSAATALKKEGIKTDKEDPKGNPSIKKVKQLRDDIRDCLTDPLHGSLQEFGIDLLQVPTIGTLMKSETVSRASILSYSVQQLS